MQISVGYDGITVLTQIDGRPLSTRQCAWDDDELLQNEYEQLCIWGKTTQFEEEKHTVIILKRHANGRSARRYMWSRWRAT